MVYFFLGEVQRTQNDLSGFYHQGEPRTLFQVGKLMNVYMSKSFVNMSILAGESGECPCQKKCIR